MSETVTQAPPPTGAPPPELGRCLVCGETIQPGNLVGCTACDTPHHRDCFEYNGRCAVYACGSQRYALKYQKTGRRVTFARSDRGWSAAAPGSQDARPIAVPVAAMPVAAGEAEDAGDSATPSRPARAGPGGARRVREQQALGDQEIRIEAYGAVRTLGIAFASVGATMFAGCGAGGADLAGCTGCEIGDLGAGASGLEAILGFFVALIAIWFVVVIVLPILLRGLGYTLYWFDNSYWTVDDRRRLVLKTRIFGIPFWTRRWAPGTPEHIFVGPLRGGPTNWLVVRFRGGRQVFLADDRRHERMGYDLQDLRRMGARLARTLGIEMSNTAYQEERDSEPAE